MNLEGWLSRRVRHAHQGMVGGARSTPYEAADRSPRRRARHAQQSAVIALCMLSFAALAHEGHDHGAETPVVPAQAAPRTVAVSEDFELVAVLEPDALRLYLDHAASNAPVTGASIEVESGPLKVQAQSEAAGVYRLPRSHWATPGKHPLTFTLVAREASDLLTTTLETPAPAATPVQAPGRFDGWMLAAGLGVLGLAGFFWWRGRR